MGSCTHHWRQIGDLRSPFVCARCGEAKFMDTIFDEIQERRSAVHRDPAASGQPYNKAHALMMIERTRDVSESVNALLASHN